MLFIIYSATDSSSIESSLGLPEYSYYFVLKEFQPMLEKLGRVHVVKCPETEVDPLYDSCQANGEQCVFLSFSPPNKTPTTLRCPTIPVFAWEFDTLPNETWDGDPSNDWTHVLATLGRAITHSRHTVATIRRAMGDDYPALSVPSPLWDRFEGLRQKYPPTLRKEPVTLRIQGNVLDSAVLLLRTEQHEQHEQASPAHFHKTIRYRLDSTKRFALEWYRDALRDLLPGRLANQLSNTMRKVNWWRQRRAQVLNNKSAASIPLHALTLDGIIYTTVLNPYDGRKNWLDMISAFCEAFADTPNATLVFKFTCLKSDWAFLLLSDALRRCPPFQCRVIGIHGYLDDESYEQLIAFSTYTINSSLGEGQCLPLMEFMACGKPAIAPRHTAMEDYIDEDVAFIVDSAEEPCCWPHDSRMLTKAHRHRVNWQSLRDAYVESYRVATSEPERYLHMSQSSINRLRDHASHWNAIEKLGEFFGLREPKEIEPPPRPLSSLPEDLPNSCGLDDAVMSGWFNADSGELVPGFEVTSEDTVVDVGCGTGGASLFCARQGATVYFLDVEQEKVEEASQRLASTNNERCFGLVSDTNPLPLEDGIATRVVAMEMLEHVDDPQQIMTELVRIGRPGALYLLSVPDAKGEHLQKDFAAPEHYQAPNHVRIYSREGFAELVEQSGLVIEQRQYVGFYWVIWMYLFWAYHRLSEQPFDGATLDKLCPPYPTALEDWALLWMKLLKTPEGPGIKSLLDESLAKSQIIIARKP